MKAVILAGGLGTRISEESVMRPKPMIEIGGYPILWHIMKTYASHGINDFVICCGYKGYMIKEYFANYSLHLSDVTFDFAEGSMKVHHKKVESWKVTLVDTGENTQTGGRVKRVRDYIGDSTFCMTYGDGVGDINITAALQFHRKHQKLATMTAVQPPGRFGALVLDQDRIIDFTEKPVGDGGWINGGYFILEPQVLDLIQGDDISWEVGPLAQLVQKDQLQAYRHSGFWMPMDTARDKQALETFWQSGHAPWKVWS
jgi:glucose-1-phosphate cytidylyltransferase